MKPSPLDNGYVWSVSWILRNILAWLWSTIRPNTNRESSFSRRIRQIWLLFRRTLHESIHYFELFLLPHMLKSLRYTWSVLTLSRMPSKFEVIGFKVTLVVPAVTAHPVQKSHKKQLWQKISQFVTFCWITDENRLKSPERPVFFCGSCRIIYIV